MYGLTREGLRGGGGGERMAGDELETVALGATRAAASLLDGVEMASTRSSYKWRTLGISTICCVAIIAVCLVVVAGPVVPSALIPPTYRDGGDSASPAGGVGVSVHKSTRRSKLLGGAMGVHSHDTKLWEDSEVSRGMKFEQSLPYRTAFHFQPRKNWMNDPNGMMYHMGYYHLFYQYNPLGALWGNIVWGHAVSKDLIHWKYVDDMAIAPGPGWYDLYGAWSGSSTILRDGTPALLYTGWSNASSQVQIQTQNLALPVNKSDPLLREWRKAPQNPVMVAEPFMDATKFRDPTEGWRALGGGWRTLVGGKLSNGAGAAHMYKSDDFVKWEYSHDIHSVNGTGMWECPDFFPVSKNGTKRGLDFSVNGNEVKHVMKVSLDDKKHDYYSVGTYDEVTETFKGESPETEVGIGLRYDYGKYYASKSFLDQKTGRRIVFGWINESDSDMDAIVYKGWSGIQAIPRQLWLDPVTGLDLIQTPVEEVDGLHRDKVSKKKFMLTAGSVMPIDGIHGPQLDIQLKFYKPKTLVADLLFDASDKAGLGAQEICSQGGAATRGLFGPFGVLVLAEKDLKEQTAVYFYLLVGNDGTWKGIVCSDQSRSSMQDDVDKTVYGSYVRVLKSDKYLTLRTLVDHSVVESFAQGGRTCITSRVYPTVAIDNAAHFYLFNNGTQDIRVHSLQAWKMENISIEQLQL